MDYFILIIRKKNPSDVKCFLGPILWIKIKQMSCLPSVERQFPAWVADEVSAPRAQRNKSVGSGKNTPASSHADKEQLTLIRTCLALPQD